MSVTDDYTDPIDDEPAAGEPGWRKRLEAQARRAKELEAQLEATNRLNAVLQAGIDVTSPLGKLFVKGYDGPAEVEAIKAAAAEAGVLSQPAPTPPQVPDAEREAQQRMQQTVDAGGEAPPPVPEGVDALRGVVADLAGKYKITDADGQEAVRRILDQARKDGRRVAGYDE